MSRVRIIWTPFLMPCFADYITGRFPSMPVPECKNKREIKLEHTKCTEREHNTSIQETSDHVNNLINFHVSDYEATLFRDIFPQNQPVPLVDNLSTVRSKVTLKKKAKEGTMTGSSN